LTDPINNFQIFSSSIYYYNNTKHCLIKYDISEYKQTDYNWKVGNVFVVLKNEEIASLSGNYLTKYPKKDEDKQLKLNTAIKMFYDNKYDHLYIFCNSEIKIVEMKKMEILILFLFLFMKILIFLNFIRRVMKIKPGLIIIFFLVVNFSKTFQIIYVVWKTFRGKQTKTKI
jgi:hypothetical protein